MFVKDGLDWRFIPTGVCFVDDDAPPEGGEPSKDALTEEPPKDEPSAEPPKAEDFDWRTLITDPDAKKEAERTTDLDAVFKRVVGLRKELSSSIKVPGKDAEDEEVAAFHKAIGVPESAEDYVFPELSEEQLTDEVKAFREGWANTFHELKIPKEAAEQLAAKFHEQNVAAEQAQVEADKKFIAEQDETLQKKWPGDEFKRNKELARRAIEKLATDAGVDTGVLRKLEMGNERFLLDDANILQLFATVGRQMDSGTLGDDLTDADRDSLQEQVEEKRKQIKEAQNEGNRKKANRLHQEELQILDKMKAA